MHILYMCLYLSTYLFSSSKCGSIMNNMVIAVMCLASTEFLNIIFQLILELQLKQQ